MIVNRDKMTVRDLQDLEEAAEQTYGFKITALADGRGQITSEH